MTNDLATRLATAVETESAALRQVTEQEAAIQQAGKWSRKEEIGHLIDSAANNHIRFVRGAIEPEFRGPGYDQNVWVRLHSYHELPWATLVDFWSQYNAILARVVANIPADRFAARCWVKDVEMTLGFVIEDYMRHMQHHLDHILRREIVTEYPARTVAI